RTRAQAGGPGRGAAAFRAGQPQGRHAGRHRNRPRARGDRTSAGGGGGLMLVMIAENDGLHRSFARRTVEQLWPGDVEVIEAGDGENAINLAAERQPPHVVLDLQLPKATGIEVARAIWSRRAGTHILFWSNFADEAYVRGVARIVPPGSVYGYVLKSATEEGMRSALRGVFREGHCIIDREIRGIQHRVQDRFEGITDGEYESLIDIALGLTDRAIAA